MAELIGVGRCPIGCGSTKARYTLSAKQLAVGTCNACNCQVFARSDRSDEILRSNIAPAEAPAADPGPAPTPPPAPGPGDEPPAATPAPIEATPTKRIGWGVLRGQEVK
jgi:hypothetical protein